MSEGAPSVAELKRAFWEAHRQEQLVVGLSATPQQRLAWLEAAIEFAHRAGALPPGPTADDR